MSSEFIGLIETFIEKGAKKIEAWCTTNKEFLSTRKRGVLYDEIEKKLERVPLLISFDGNPDQIYCTSTNDIGYNLKFDSSYKLIDEHSSHFYYAPYTKWDFKFKEEIKIKKKNKGKGNSNDGLGNHAEESIKDYLEWKWERFNFEGSVEKTFLQLLFILLALLVIAWIFLS